MDPTHPLAIFLQLFERGSLLLMCLFVLTRIPRFKAVFQKEEYRPQDLVTVTAIFGLFAIFGTYMGISVEGSLVNVRIVAIMSGGLLFGPWVGIVTGIVAGVHRYLIDIGGVTALPCLITSIVAGGVSGLIHLRVAKRKRWLYGIAAGMLCEVLTMLLILWMAEPYALGLDIVSKIAAPMILAQVMIGLIVMLVQSVEEEKENVAAKQAKLALDIANETLPYFRKVDSLSLLRICEIIEQKIGADAVAITDTSHILAYSGFGQERYNIGHEIMTEETKQSIRSGSITIRNNDADHRNEWIKSMIIIPLQEKGVVTGALKIYYRHAHQITYSLRELAVGLSQIISTLMEVSRVEQIKAMADKAEIKALQTKISPHFLFNALNAIASSIRLDPDKARELIINLSGYLRYNLELNDELIEVHRELQQVKDYVEIEKARFGNRLQVEYDIDDETDVKIPSLIIQPLVENAIVHGILKDKGKGTVTIRVKNEGDRVRFEIADTGVGIDRSVIERIQSGSMPSNKIGLSNVHERLKLIYGQGVDIRRADKGTVIGFTVGKGDRE
ncbi:sensor histidine kinase [Saccharibacillus endophyticus]|uniref:histidine kinase n=1 Tax=Saccharibacillus endophyticus TaxID=2060666 RepID=A0ABQ1ZR90_9BACL|nr:sensor histidine kinase [Saccharibacillus endophyticus]GGH73240.1 membrane protein [Saccharibacillus endophyticus]